MKKFFLSAAAFAVVAVSAIAVAPNTAEAVPAFARQTGAACLSCHFQAIPRLAAMGRNFSLNGMRDMGEGALLEDDHLSLPVAFNATFITIARFLSSSGNAYNVAGANNAIQWPDETAILVGGRYGEHMGGLAELSMRQDGPGLAQSKIDYVIDLDSGLLAVAAFSGDLGAGWALNDPSNAVRQNTRSSQQRGRALNATIMMNNAISGLGIYAYLNDMIYFAIAGITPAAPGTISVANATGAQTAEGGDLEQLSPYARLALITELAGLEAVVGVWYTNLSPAIATDVAADAAAARAAGDAQQYGVDLQLQGDMGDVSVGLYVPIVIKGEQVVSTGNPVKDINGYQVIGTAAFGHMGVKLGYDYKRTKTLATSTSTKTKGPYVGGWYSLAQNVELDLAYQSIKTDGGISTNTTQLVFEFVY